MQDTFASQIHLGPIQSPAPRVEPFGYVIKKTIQDDMWLGSDNRDTSTRDNVPVIDMDRGSLQRDWSHGLFTEQEYQVPSNPLQAEANPLVCWPGAQQPRSFPTSAPGSHNGYSGPWESAKNVPVPDGFFDGIDYFYDPANHGHWAYADGTSSFVPDQALIPETFRQPDRL